MTIDNINWELCIGGQLCSTLDQHFPNTSWQRSDDCPSYIYGYNRKTNTVIRIEDGDKKVPNGMYFLQIFGNVDANIVQWHFYKGCNLNHLIFEGQVKL